MLISAGEDGTVRIWDSRAKEIVNILKPYDFSSVSRPDLGPWIGDVSLNEDWMVCLTCILTIYFITNLISNFVNRFAVEERD